MKNYIQETWISVTLKDNKEKFIRENSLFNCIGEKLKSYNIPKPNSPWRAPQDALYLALEEDICNRPIVGTFI